MKFFDKYLYLAVVCLFGSLHLQGDGVEDFYELEKLNTDDYGSLNPKYYADILIKATKDQIDKKIIMRVAHELGKKKGLASMFVELLIYELMTIKPEYFSALGRLVTFDEVINADGSPEQYEIDLEPCPGATFGYTLEGYLSNEYYGGHKGA